MDLNEARERIGAIDEEMAALFERRMEAVRAVAAYKKNHSLPIEDKAQESAKLTAHGALISDEAMRPFYQRFLENTIEVSKLWQRHLIEGASLEELLAEDRRPAELLHKETDLKVSLEHGEKAVEQ